MPNNNNMTASATYLTAIYMLCTCIFNPNLIFLFILEQDKGGERETPM